MSSPTSLAKLLCYGWMLLAGAASLVVSPAAMAQIPRSNHVYIVAEENRSYEHIVGSPDMPYLNSILPKGTTATQFYSDMHGSLENYLIVTAGQYITHNNSTTATFSVDNIERHLLAQGKTFKSYAQTLPYAGYTGLTYGEYLKRHAPLPYYTDMASSSLIMNHVSTTQLAKDIANGTLPNFAFITPDAAHDMHDCPTTLSACLQMADTWLKDNIAPLLATAPFQPGGDGVLIIWADEADLSTDSRCSATVLSGCGGHILVAMIGPQIMPNGKSVFTYHHPSVLKTMLMLLGEEVTFPSAAQNAPPMVEFFKSAGAVYVASPTASTVVGPSVHVAATASAPTAVTAMKVYVDGVAQYSASANSVDATIPMTYGTHNVTYQAWDNKGNVYKAAKSVKVIPPGVTILAPTTSTLSGSPVQMAASAVSQHPITAMRIYVDGVSEYGVSASSVSTSLGVTVGTHTVTFQAWDSAGNVYKASKTITVQ